MKTQGYFYPHEGWKDLWEVDLLSEVLVLWELAWEVLLLGAVVLLALQVQPGLRNHAGRWGESQSLQQFDSHRAHCSGR